MGLYDAVTQTKEHKEVREEKCGRWVSRLDPATKGMYSTQAFCKDWVGCPKCRKRKEDEFYEIASSAKYIAVVNSRERRNLTRRLGGADYYRSIPQGNDHYFVFHNNEDETIHIFVEKLLKSNKDNFLSNTVYKWAKASGRISGKLGKKQEKEVEEETEREEVSVKSPVYYKPDSPELWAEIVESAYTKTYNLLPDEDSLQEDINTLHKTIMSEGRKRGVNLTLARWEIRNIAIDDIDWSKGRSLYKRNNSDDNVLPLSDDGKDENKGYIPPEPRHYPVGNPS